MSNKTRFAGVSMLLTLALSVVAQASPPPPSDVPAPVAAAKPMTGKMAAAETILSIDPDGIVVSYEISNTTRKSPGKCPNNTMVIVEHPGSGTTHKNQNRIDDGRALSAMADQCSVNDNGDCRQGRMQAQANATSGYIRCARPSSVRTKADAERELKQAKADREAAEAARKAAEEAAKRAEAALKAASTVVVTTPPVEAPKAEPAPAAVAVPVAAPTKPASTGAKKNALYLPLGAGIGTALSTTSVNYAKGALDTTLGFGFRLVSERLSGWQPDFRVRLGSHVDYLPRGTADRGFVFMADIAFLKDLGGRIPVGPMAWYAMARASLDDQAYIAFNGGGVGIKVMGTISWFSLFIQGGPGIAGTAQPGRIGGLNMPQLAAAGEALAGIEFQIPALRW